MIVYGKRVCNKSKDNYKKYNIVSKLQICGRKKKK